MDPQDSRAQEPVRVSLNSAADPFEVAPTDGTLPEPVSDVTSGSSQLEASPHTVTSVTPGEAPIAPAEEEKPETPTAPAEQPPTHADLMAKIQRIAEHDARLRSERQQARALKAEAEAKIAEINKFNEDLQRLKSNPIEAAKFLNIDPRELIRGVLGEEAAPKTELEILQEKLERQEAWRLQQEQAVQEAKAQAEREQQNAAMQRLLNEAERGVRESGDTFELINATGDYQRVLDTQIEYYNLHKVPLDWRTAAQAVESALEKQARTLASAKKISAGFTAQTTQQTAAQKPQAQPAVTQAPKAIPGSKTLTMRPVAAPTIDAPARVSLSNSYADRDDSIEQIAAALRAARAVG